MDTVGRITQLTNNSSDNLESFKREWLNSRDKIVVAPELTVTELYSKSELINRLKAYREDYEITENDDAMQKVIDWFINVTPDYKD